MKGEKSYTGKERMKICITDEKRKKKRYEKKRKA